MANDGTINERPDEQVTYVSIGLVSVIIIAAVVIYGIGFTQQKQADGYENKIAGVDKQVTKLQEVKEHALALGIQEEEIGSLYKRQDSWSKAIIALSDNSLKKITFTSVSIDGSGQVNITGTANNYMDVNKQVVALNSSGAFEEAFLTNVNYQEGVLNFTVIANLAL